MRLLIEVGADVNKTNRDGETPLFIAIQSGQYTLVQPLIKAGADVDISDGRGSTPLSLAVSDENETVVRALIEAGADVGVAAPGKNAAVHRRAEWPRGGGAGADRGGRGRQQRGEGELV